MEKGYKVIINEGRGIEPEVKAFEHEVDAWREWYDIACTTDFKVELYDCDNDYVVACSDHGTLEN